MLITFAALLVLYVFLRWRASKTVTEPGSKHEFFEGHIGRPLVLVVQEAELLNERPCVVWSAGPHGIELEHAGRRIQLTYGQIRAVKDGDQIVAAWR
jgi:hypothetical protein